MTRAWYWKNWGPHFFFFRARFGFLIYFIHQVMIWVNIFKGHLGPLAISTFCRPSPNFDGNWPGGPNKAGPRQKVLEATTNQFRLCNSTMENIPISPRLVHLMTLSNENNNLNSIYIAPFSMHSNVVYEIVTIILPHHAGQAHVPSALRMQYSPQPTGTRYTLVNKANGS